MIPHTTGGWAIALVTVEKDGRPCSCCWLAITANQSDLTLCLRGIFCPQANCKTMIIEGVSFNGDEDLEKRSSYRGGG